MSASTPVAVVAEFLHTGSPPLAADDAATAIVGALEAAGFVIGRACPHCEVIVADAWGEVEHMQKAHPDVLRERGLQP